MEFSTHTLALEAHTHYSGCYVCVCGVSENLLTIFLIAALECSAAVAISSKDSGGGKQHVVFEVNENNRLCYDYGRDG